MSSKRRGATKLAALALSLIGMVALACTDNGPSNAADVPSTETPGPITEVMPLATTFAIAARAEALCPDKDPDVFRRCGQAYADAVRSGSVTIMCVNASEGLFYFAEPGATPLPTQAGSQAEGRQIGDDCSKPDYQVVDLFSG